MNDESNVEATTQSTCFRAALCTYIRGDDVEAVPYQFGPGFC